MTVVDPVPDRLLKSSARQSYDPEVDIDWNAPPVEGMWWMQPELMSLYGTKTWGRLSGLALQAGITVPANDCWVAACCVSHDYPC